MSICVPTVIRCRAGCLEVSGWPADLAAPFGLAGSGERLRGPARLRWRVRQALQQAGRPVRDETRMAVGPVTLAAAAQDVVVAALSADGAALWSALRRFGFRGLLAGVPEVERVSLLRRACVALGGPVLLVVADSGAEQRWRQALAAMQQDPRAVEVRSLASAARDAHWLGSRHDVLCIDAIELLPCQTLERLLDASAALARIAFCGRIDWRLAARFAAGLGPVVCSFATDAVPRCNELRVPMPEACERSYAHAWSIFLAAFDRFAALRAGAGFGAFVAQARHDPLQRPALTAWHEALRLAAWHEHKAAVVGELLERHRGQRVLVFTPDRQVAYELSRQHLIAAVTAELPARERAQLLQSFADGSLRALAGPRLLDLGVPEGSADVAILVGGGFGREQRRARCRRVADSGLVYELVSLDTVEVGRGHRWRDTAAAHTAVVP